MQFSITASVHSHGKIVFVCFVLLYYFEWGGDSQQKKGLFSFFFFFIPFKGVSMFNLIASTLSQFHPYQLKSVQEHEASADLVTSS